MLIPHHPLNTDPTREHRQYTGTRQITTGNTTAVPRFANSAGITAPVSTMSTRARFGALDAGGLVASIGRGMSYLEADPIKALVVSDLGGMVVPRTGIEWHKRGITPARETFFREITGTVTNTFLAGWLGLAAVWAFAIKRANPKGVDFQSWVDSKTLNTFGKITDNILTSGKAKSAQEVREKFLETVLGRLKSTDAVPEALESIEQFKGRGYGAFFPNKGKLGSDATRGLVDRFMGKHYAEYPYNIEEAIAKGLKSKVYQDEMCEALAAVRHQTLEANGFKPLSGLQQKLLRRLETSETGRILADQTRRLRMMETQKVRELEATFIERVYNFAVKHGKLSDELFLLDEAGKPMESLGIKGTKDMFRSLGAYLKILDRGLANPETGVIAKDALWVDGIRQRLFGTVKGNWIQRNLMPNVQDGLLPYIFKSKYFIVLAPLLATIAVGSAMVYVNNAITRNKTGGNYFPGAKALMDQERGGRA
jgi:hypothetical protein